MCGACNPPDGPQRERLSFRRLHAFTMQKHPDDPNEDRWCESRAGMIYALSDGASVSFDPKIWAAILVRRFTENPTVSRAWIEAAATEYNSAHDREAMPWMQQAAFDRGSFATLLGIELSADWRVARVFAIGDTVLAFIDSGQVVRTIPYVQ